MDRADPTVLPVEAADYEQKKLRLLVAFCREIQRAAPGVQFFLSCRTAGGLLGISHTKAAEWLRLLVADDILEEKEKGGINKDTGEQRASRYLYIASDLP